MHPLCVQASLPQTVAAMRFILAYQSCTSGQAQGPLSEEDFLARVHEWATTEPTSARSAVRPLLLIHSFLQRLCRLWEVWVVMCRDAAAILICPAESVSTECSSIMVQLHRPIYAGDSASTYHETPRSTSSYSTLRCNPAP